MLVIPTQAPILRQLVSKPSISGFYFDFHPRGSACAPAALLQRELERHPSSRRGRAGVLLSMCFPRVLSFSSRLHSTAWCLQILIPSGRRNLLPLRKRREKGLGIFFSKERIAGIWEMIFFSLLCTLCATESYHQAWRFPIPLYPLRRMGKTDLGNFLKDFKSNGWVIGSSNHFIQFNFLR